MTIEQRAKETCDGFISEGYLKAVGRSLRKLIEECAVIVEEEYRQSLLRNDPNPGIDPLLTATKIRALAGD